MPKEGRRERKVVTVVFCDLVGFTARAETLDPEDVEAILRPYHERVRTELERHGGTVEKFIGDAVMALFGAPAAHEDDPERAVRAALAIREFATTNGLELRIGVTSGEALISLDANPATGEGMAAGDVVNTAARLQAAAPVNGLLVDDTTRRATRSAIDYEPAEAVQAKGKSEPVTVWRATGARSRFGTDVTHDARTELVGREREVSILRDAFERAIHDQIPQLVTLVAVPGMGKSRLVYELQKIVESEPDLITWRQGRCIAYGAGIAFWALGEVVKAQAGILEQDSGADASRKLQAVVADLLGDGSDAGWVEPLLRPLVGLETDIGLGGDRRGQAFAAWRRFIEALAETRPVVLVLEDLHWADDGLLDFVDDLADSTHGIPLLIVCTARPELLERRPGWGGGKMNATTIGLQPLSADQTALLISRTLDRPLLPADIQQALLDRAEGNPLFAEQFAQLYLERRTAAELPLPETLQGILAARIDGLSADEKELLHDAAVFGKVFWAGALGRPADPSVLLYGLERKGFLVRQRRSSVEGETEWSFAHSLLRDTAYGQIPRAERARKHRRVAEWIAALGRPDDHAELLALHWSAALDLARAAGQDAAELEESARLALRAAGDRAFSVYAYPRAADYYAQALALWPANAPDRAEVLFRRAMALHIAGDDRSVTALEEARDSLLASGDNEHAADAETYIGRAWWERGKRNEAFQHMAAAERLVGTTRSPAAARVLAFSARQKLLAGEQTDVIRLAGEALAMAQGLDLTEVAAHALCTIGTTKSQQGDASGVEDMERAIEMATEVGSPVASGSANNLAIDYWFRGDLRREGETYARALRLSEQFGDGAGARWMRGQIAGSHFLLGDWDSSLREQDAFIAECEAGSPHYLEAQARWVRSQIRLGRGDVDGALADAARGMELARMAKDPQVLVHAIASTARIQEALGQAERGRELARDFAGIGKDVLPAEWMAFVARWLLGSPSAVGLETEMHHAVEQAPAGMWKNIGLASLADDYARAADLAWEAGDTSLSAYLREAAARDLTSRGRVVEGRAQLDQAIEFYGRVGARFLIDRCEALLGQAKSA